MAVKDRKEKKKGTHAIENSKLKNKDKIKNCYEEETSTGILVEIL